MTRSEYNVGQFLVCDDLVFIHNGYGNAGGYGVIIGEVDKDLPLLHATGTCNWWKCGDVRPATPDEIKYFIGRIYHSEAIQAF